MNILNDTEHRIFLSAMAREKEICQKIDGDKIYDSTVKMLAPVCESIERKVDRAILVPENATNGDMIKAMFPNAIIEINELGSMVHVKYDNHTCWVNYELEWWNAPYKESEGANENS